MATHSSILTWRIPMDRGAWQGCSPWGHKESDMTKWLSTYNVFLSKYQWLVAFLVGWFFCGCVFFFFFFAEMENLTLKFIQNCKRPWVIKTILKRKTMLENSRLTDLKTCYKATVVKNVWYRCKDRHVDQWNRIKSSEINPNTYS